MALPFMWAQAESASGYLLRVPVNWDIPHGLAKAKTQG